MFSIAPLRTREAHFGLRFTGHVRVPADAVYTFYSDSWGLAVSPIELEWDVEVDRA
jgi:hypothetical protein